MILPTICVTCISNDYTLNGSSCIQKVVVGVEIKFDYNFKDFLKEGKLKAVMNALKQGVAVALYLTFIR
jgi:hypothetical protein